jgi:hypothetical protein
MLIPQYLKEIDKREKMLAFREKRRKRKQEIASLTQTKRLGPHKYEELPKWVPLTGIISIPMIEWIVMSLWCCVVCTSDELPKSLREVPTVNTLLFERMRSLQKRNIIEVRKKVEPRNTRPKKKAFERRSAKLEVDLL